MLCPSVPVTADQHKLRYYLIVIGPLNCKLTGSPFFPFEPVQKKTEHTHRALEKFILRDAFTNGMYDAVGVSFTDFRSRPPL